MLITAKEAATKRCQEGFASAPVMNSGGASMMVMAGSCFAQATSPMFCIAGQCMAWRWTDQRTLDGGLLGFCGKAGPVPPAHQPNATTD
jgi:hypothetical protein